MYRYVYMSVYVCVSVFMMCMDITMILDIFIYKQVSKQKSDDKKLAIIAILCVVFSLDFYILQKKIKKNILKNI